MFLQLYFGILNRLLRLAHFGLVYHSAVCSLLKRRPQIITKMSYHKKKLAVKKRNASRRTLAEKNYQEYYDRDDDDVWMKAFIQSPASLTTPIRNNRLLKRPYFPFVRDDDDDYSDELKIIEKSGNLFDAPADFAVAIADLTELKGDPATVNAFKNEFTSFLNRQGDGIKIGTVDVQKHNDRLVFYLVARSRKVKQPSYARLAMCLEITRESMVRCELDCKSIH